MQRNGALLAEIADVAASRPCESSQSWSRGEERIQSAAASSRKGVVGSSGTKMPTTPSTRHRPPNAASNVFMAAKIRIFSEPNRLMPRFSRHEKRR